MQHMSIMARLKKPLHVYIDAELAERLDAWLAKQVLPPSKTTLVELAIKELLDRLEKSKKSP